jgi:Rap guanine nucleotide exchange factor 2
MYTRVCSSSGIFIAKVDVGGQAERIGLKRGDELLEVNGMSCQQMTHAKVLDLLRGGTHLALTVKSNLLGFKELLLNCQQGGGHDTTVCACGVSCCTHAHYRSRRQVHMSSPMCRQKASVTCQSCSAVWPAVSR